MPSLSGKALDREDLLSGNYWAELRILLAVAKAKSIGGAAKSLGVSKSKVSRQLQRLQDKVSAALVVVSKSGVRLTREGEGLAELLLTFDRQLSAATDDIRSGAKRIEGVVRVSVTDGLGLTVVVPALVDFTRRQANIQIHLKTPANIRSLRENATDIMLGFGRDGASDIQQRILGTVHLIPFASRSYLERFEAAVQRTVSQHVFINSERYAAQDGIWRAWNELAARGRTAYFADSAVTYAAMVKLGLGIGLLPSFNAVEPSLVAQDLGVGIDLQLCEIVLRERLKARHVRIVYDFLGELFSADVDWFRPELAINPQSRSRVSEGYRKAFNLEPPS